MRESLFETLIGFAVVAVAAVFLVFSLQQRSDAAPGGGYSLQASFKEAGGISRGTDVRLAGVKVGSVTGIVIDPQIYRAVVTFTVQDDLQIPDDSTLQVTSDGLLGGAYLNLRVGGSFDYLAPGGMVEFTRGSVDLLTVLSEVASAATGGGSGADTDGADEEFE
jgi:phospholipid/cholesterol/gamma-HCH transport system substrate-binding protein